MNGQAGGKTPPGMGFWMALPLAFVLSAVGLVVCFFAAIAASSLNGMLLLFGLFSLGHATIWVLVCVRLAHRGAQNGVAGVVAGVCLMIVVAIALVADFLANFRLGGF